MVRLAVNEITTFRWSFEEDVLNLRRMGFDSIGLWRPKVCEYGIEKAAELLAEEGMTPTSLSWAGGFTGSDGRSFRDAMHDALDAIEAAAQLGAGCLVMVAGGRNNHARSHARRILTLALTQLAEAAAAVGIQLALEPMHAGCAADWTFVTDVRHALELVGEVGRSNLGIVFDTYHLGMDPQVTDWLPEVARQIRLVQVGDGRHQPMGEQNRCPLGHGRVPNQELLRILLDAGYNGGIEIELCGEEMEHLDYASMLHDARDYLERAMHLVDPAATSLVKR